MALGIVCAPENITLTWDLLDSEFKKTEIFWNAINEDLELEDTVDNKFPNFDIHPQIWI